MVSVCHTTTTISHWIMNCVKDIIDWSRKVFRDISIVLLQSYSSAFNGLSYRRLLTEMYKCLYKTKNAISSFFDGCRAWPEGDFQELPHVLFWLHNYGYHPCRGRTTVQANMHGCPRRNLQYVLYESRKGILKQVLWKKGSDTRVNELTDTTKNDERKVEKMIILIRITAQNNRKRPKKAFWSSLLSQQQLRDFFKEPP